MTTSNNANQVIRIQKRKASSFDIWYRRRQTRLAVLQSLFESMDKGAEVRSMKALRARAISSEVAPVRVKKSRKIKDLEEFSTQRGRKPL